MDFNEFLPTCKGIVAKYHNEHLDSFGLVHSTVTPEDVYVVWYNKTLQNAKALLSTPINDGMYYEMTYNGDKDELYLDAYKKTDNMVLTSKPKGANA